MGRNDRHDMKRSHSIGCLYPAEAVSAAYCGRLISMEQKLRVDADHERTERIDRAVLKIQCVTPSPGDPIRTVQGDMAADEQVAAMREEVGLNDPLPAQFYNYINSYALEMDIPSTFATVSALRSSGRS